MTAIRTTNVTKVFGRGGRFPWPKHDDGVVAVDGLDVVVEAGEIFGFLGPSGAGKTTTVDILLDHVRPTEGRVEVFGMDAQEQTAEVHSRIGVLPENVGLWDRLTARQHVELAIRTKEGSDDPGELLRRVGLEDAVDRRVGEFSDGMSQRLALAMALVDAPDLLVLDEPTVGLDPDGVQLLREIIRAEVDRGATVLFSSQLLEEVDAICDQVAMIRDGDLVAVKPIEQFRAAVDGIDEVAITVDSTPVGVVTQLRRVEGVVDVDLSGREILVTCTTDAAKDAAVGEVRELGAIIRDRHVEDPDLETLFAAFESGEGEPDTEADDPGRA